MRISWAEVYSRLQSIPPGKLYGIPRGGSIVAGLTGRAVDSPEAADFIVDDILDSGRTRESYKQFNKPFWFLVDKKSEGLLGQWIQLPWEHADPLKDIADTVVRQLEFLGENPSRDGLRDTPNRVVRSLLELTDGYRQDPVAILGTTFDEAYDEMVVVRDIEFSSLCEHHLLPFTGVATVAYIPTARVVGLSKIARLVHCYARRLQIQERLTKQIAGTLQDVLRPNGVAVMLRATHSCMRLRGIKSSGDLVTSCLLGFFRDRQDTRNEFLRLCAG